MSVLSAALQREEWEVAALCLLLGLAQSLSRLPPDAVLGLVEMAEGGVPELAPKPTPKPEGRSRYAPQAG